MPTSARTLLGFFGQFADVGIRAPEQNGLLQQALVSIRMPTDMPLTLILSPLREGRGNSSANRV